VYVSPDHFSVILGAFLNWRNTGLVQIFVGPTAHRALFSVKLQEDEQDVQDFLNANSLTMPEVREGIRDILDVLSALVSEATVEEFVATRGDKERLRDGEVEEEAVARQKFEQIAEAFDILSLRRREWIKATSKNPLLVNVGWEVLVKQRDELEASPNNGGVPFAVLRLTTEAPESPSIFPQPPEDLVVTVDAEDVDNLIGSLARLKDTMASADKVNE
jgi:hypothetical protein